jgi:hypothetical protein
VKRISTDVLKLPRFGAELRSIDRTFKFDRLLRALSAAMAALIGLAVLAGFAFLQRPAPPHRLLRRGRRQGHPGRPRRRVAGYRYELLGHQLSGNLFVEPYLVTLLPEAQPYVTFQHPGIKFLHLLTGRVAYRYGGKIVKMAPGDSLQFDATALHGIEAIEEEPVSYLSVVFTMRA